MRYIPFRDLIRCHRVSRSWRAILTSDPSLYRKVDLTCARRPLTSQHIKVLARYAGDDIRELRYREARRTFAESIISELRNAPMESGWRSHRGRSVEPLLKNLHVLHQEGDDQFPFVFIPPYTTFAAASLRRFHTLGLLLRFQIEILFHTAPNLESLRFKASHIEIVGGSFPNIKFLCLESDGGAPPPDEKTLSAFPGLEELIFENYIEIRVLNIGQFLPNLKILRHIGSLLETHSITCWSPHLRILDVWNAPSLKELSISPKASLVEVSLQ